MEQKLSEKLDIYVASIREKHIEERAGQTYFNVLYSINPEIANKIRGTKYDPFHDDTRLILFREKVDELYLGEYNG
jgi:hypothetical protein